MERTKVTCPQCKKECWMVDEKNFIARYGKCNTCILSDSLGHQYFKPPALLTMCKNCFCMTKTIHGFCGKCKHLKNN